MKLDATRRKGERFTFLLLSVFYQFFCVYIIVTMVRAQLCYSYGEKPSDYLWNERIENCEAFCFCFVRVLFLLDFSVI